MRKIFFEFLLTDFMLLLRGRVGMFWTLFFPAFMLILQMSVFGVGGTLGPIDIGVVDLDRSLLSSSYMDFFQEATIRQNTIKVRLVKYKQSPAEEPDILLTIPAGFAEHISKELTTRVEWGGKLKKEGILFAATKSMISSITESFNTNLSGKPKLVSLAIGEGSPASSNANQVLFLVTGLSGIIILSTSLMGFAPVLVAAREAGMFKLYQVFPIPPALILITWWSSRLLMTVCATLIMFLVGWLLYDLKINSGTPEILAALLLLMLGAGAFLSIGLVIASLIDNTSTATVIANVLYFPLLFSGNLIVPVNNLPKIVQDTLGLLPLNTLIESMRGLLFGHPDIKKVLYTLVILISTIGICVYVGNKKFSWQPSN